MKLDIVHANNTKEMEEISETFLENKFGIKQQENHYILMKRRRIGNIYVHLLCILIVIGFPSLMYVLFVNVIYFAISYIWRSPIVLITTETKAENGEPLEFTNVDNVLEKGNALF